MIRNVLKHVPLVVIVGITVISAGIFIVLGVQASGVASQSSRSKGVTLRQPAALTNGLVGWWKFDGDSTDSTAKGYVLKENNIVYGGTSGYVQGKFGKGFLFDNSNDSLCNEGFTFENGGSAITASFWVNPTVNWSSGTSQKEMLTADTGIIEVMYTTGGIRVITYGTSVLNTDYTVNLAAGTWYHIVTTITLGGNITVYLNGSQVAQQSMTAAWGGRSLTKRLCWGGSEAVPSVATAATLDDGRIYNRALSTTEIGQLYAGSNPAACDQACVGWWKLDESSGYTAHNSAGLANRTTTLQNFTFDSSNGWISGTYGNALKFNGSSTRVNVGQVAVGSQVTFSGWINTDPTLSSFGRIFGGLNTLAVGVNADGSLNMGIGNNSVYCGTTGPSQAKGTWFHLVYTVNNTSGIVYVNGAQTNTTTHTCSLPVGNITAGIGALPAGGQPFKGSLDDLRLYNYALSASEASTLYTTGSLPSDTTGRLTNWWKFDESTGTSAADSSVVSRGSGALQAMSFTTSTSGWNPGIFGNGMAFDGTDDYIDAGSEAVNSISTNRLTVSGWIKADGVPGVYNFIISNAADCCTTTNNGFGLQLTNNRNLSFTINNQGSGIKFLNTTRQLTLGEWYHVAATADGTSMKIYINGILNNQTANTPVLGSPATRPLTIGRLAGTGLYSWRGSLDDIRVYDRALSDYEIAEQYGMGR